MSKRYFIPIIVISTILIVVVILFFVGVFKKTVRYQDPFLAVDPDFIYVAQVNNLSEFNNLLESNKIFELADTVLTFNQHSYFYRDFAKLLIINKEIFSKTVSPIFTYKKEGAGETFVGICVTAEDIKPKKIYELLCSKPDSKRDFNGAEIRELIINNNKYYFTVFRGLFIVSQSLKQIEKSIEKIISKKSLLHQNLVLAWLINSAGKNEPVNLFFNFKNFAWTFKNVFNDDFLSMAKNFEFFAEWISFDLNFTDEKLVFNGFLKNSQSDFFAKIIETQNPVQFSSFDVLPDNTRFFIIFSLTDIEKWTTTTTKYSKKINPDNDIEKIKNELNQKNDLDFCSEILSLVNEEVCFAEIANGKNSEAGNFFLAMKTKSGASAELKLENISKGLGEKSGIITLESVSEVQIDNKTTLKCFYIPIESWPQLVFGPAFKNLDGKYLTVYSNYIISADDKNTLKNIVYQMMLNNTLSKSIDFGNLLSDFGNKSVFFAYINFTEISDIISGFFNPSISENLKEINPTKLKLFGNWAFQINSANDLLYANLVLRYKPDINEKPETVWETRLEGNVIIKPFVVLNHDDQSKEIFVQDENFNVYLLSASGREIWRIKLDESIISKVYQVDAFKNGKLQYLFSTKNHIYLIDRLGNNVDKFPVKLRSTASSPISLFDYENNKNYRITVACEDRKVYLYDINGLLVKGWQFEKTENSVSNEILHYRVGKEDFIVFNDDYRLYLLNRLGETKLKTELNFKFSEKNKIYLISKPGPAKFVTTDENGIIRFFKLDGSTDSLKIRDFSKEHYFLVTDIDFDGYDDYVFIDSSKLEIYDFKGELKSSCSFDGNVTEEPSLYNFPSNQIKVGVVCGDIGKIYLVNSDGSIYDGFPLRGKTGFSIAYLFLDSNIFNLIVGGNEKFLYNYKIRQN
jgi:hypothetical protein